MAIAGSEIVGGQNRTGGIPLRLHLAAALAAGTALLPAAAAARTVKFPENAPAVSFELPDDWTVTPADGGLQLVSPDHTSIILAGMAKADKTGLTEWQRAAARRMVDFGIAFDAKANPSKPPQAIAEDTALAPLAGSEAQTKARAGELAPLTSVPSMALLGSASDLANVEHEATEGGDAGKAEGIAAAKVEAPPVDVSKGEAKAVEGPKPGKAAQEKAIQGKSAERTTAEKAAGKADADKTGKPLHFASVVIRGATLAGKPVDVQFLNFGYSKERWFLMQQESGADDDRAGAIIKSVRAIR